MKVKILLCGCHNMKLKPEQIDMNTLPAELDGDIDVKYAIMHPQLCGPGGNEILRDLLRVADRDTYLVIGGCDPETQMVYFGDVIAQSGVPRHHILHVDIRGMDNEHASAAILKAVGEVALREGALSFPSDGFSG
jgi:heterodisulfide reductase subunit A-like polyferredoxin